MSIHLNLGVYVQNVNDTMSRLEHSLTKFGSAASLLCAVHCALAPFAILALPFFVTRFDGITEYIFGVLLASTIEWVFWGLILGLAGMGLLITFPLHHDPRPAMLTIVGLILMVVAHLVFMEGSLLEITGVFLGALFISCGGFLNRHLCSCRGCPKLGSVKLHKDEEVKPVSASSVL